MLELDAKARYQMLKQGATTKLVTVRYKAVGGTC